MRKVKTALRMLALSGILLAAAKTPELTAQTCTDYCYTQRDQCLVACGGTLSCQKTCRQQLFDCLASC